jgi:prepilin-type N-terminal cleavage/methylation domain-containing protein
MGQTKTQLSSFGFTIVELLIATAIFSVVLMVAAFAFLQIGKSYSKGNTTARTQTVARAILDDVAQAIQFSSGDVKVPDAVNVSGTASMYFCAGEKTYTYVLGAQLEDGVNHAFMKNKGTGCAAPTAWTSNMVELLGPRMRVAYFELAQVPGSNNLFSIRIRIAHGDTDLLSDKIGADGIVDTCNEGAGKQYCAVSDLSTTVQKRI